MAMARQELGPDAMLMNSRKAPEEARRLGEYEVVFAAPTTELQNEAAALAATTPAAEPAPWLHLSGEVSQLRQQVEQMAAGIGRAVSLAGALNASPELSQALAGLLESGVEVSLAHRILDGVRNRRARSASDDLRLDFACEIEALLEADPTVGRAGRERAVAALVGPPGAGKTTTLAKLAIAQGSFQWTWSGSAGPSNCARMR
jgi:flagellar biosynthesis GTPase FlhF